MRFPCARQAAVLSFLAGALASALAHAQSGLNQNAVIYIKVKCQDDALTGAFFEPEGTGFILEKSGHVLTAYHVVSCWDPESRRKWRPTEILGRLGSRWEPPDRTLELVRFDDQSDAAILRIRGLARDYTALKICSLRNPRPETPFVAAGFPVGSDYQPIDGKIGNPEASGGRWSVASPLAAGMSGGPVSHNGFVIGIVKGGLRNVAAVNTITPIYLASRIIEDVTGLRTPECSDLKAAEAAKKKADDAKAEDEERQRLALLRQGRETKNPAENLGHAVVFIRAVLTNPISQERRVTDGSGFLIDRDGHIITARHLVIGNDPDGTPANRSLSVALRQRDGVQAPAQIVQCEQGAIDLCLIKVSKASVTDANITSTFAPACRHLRAGEQIEAMGYPLGLNNPMLKITGQITGELAGQLLNPANVLIVPGMGGGPVLDASKKVVAVSIGAAMDYHGLTFVQSLIYGDGLFRRAGVACPTGD